jgi:hypothetical protein
MFFSLSCEKSLVICQRCIRTFASRKLLRTVSKSTVPIFYGHPPVRIWINKSRRRSYRLDRTRTLPYRTRRRGTLPTATVRVDTRTKSSVAVVTESSASLMFQGMTWATLIV